MIEEKVKQLMDLMGTTKNIEASLEDALEKMKKVLPPIPELIELWDRIGKNTVKEVVTDFMKESIAPLWGEHYSEEELDALIVFYSSAVGAKIMATNTEIGKRMTQMMFSMSQKITKKLEAQMGEEDL